MTREEQRTAALVRANDKRIARADLRARLVSERGSLADIMRDPPEVLADMALVDVVRLSYGKRSAASLARLGRLACRDHINLLMPLGEASERTREWVAVHATWHWAASPTGTKSRRPGVRVA